MREELGKFSFTDLLKRYQGLDGLLAEVLNNPQFQEVFVARVLRVFFFLCPPAELGSIFCMLPRNGELS